MPECPDPYRGHRFPAAVTAHAVRPYLRFALSCRDAEELLAERGVQVRYKTVRRWVAKFGALYAEELRRREVRAGRTWHLDAMATRLGGRVHGLWRAVDAHGRTLDVFLLAQRATPRRPHGSSGACSRPPAGHRRPGSRPTSEGATPRHGRSSRRCGRPSTWKAAPRGGATSG